MCPTLFKWSNFLNNTRYLIRVVTPRLSPFVPKRKDALNLAHYRPINLIICITKIIYKTLVARLKKVIGSVFSNDQTTFVNGRNIMDGPLVVNEMITWTKKLKKMMLLFKLDGERALDLLSWTFFDDVMWQMDFCITWRSWIRSILSYSRVSVLVKESRTKEFIMEKGVRQGDPFSPFLFIIFMEGHNVAMDEALQKWFFCKIISPFLPSPVL